MYVFSVFISFYADICAIVILVYLVVAGHGGFNLVSAVFCACSRKLSDWYD